MSRFPSGFSSFRILVVEDSEPIQGMIRSHLESLGFRHIVVVGDGALAMTEIDQQAANGVLFDVVLSDMNMPNMTGMELLKALRTRPDLQRVPFVIMTSNSEAQDIVDALNQGATNYIIKPVASRVLNEKLSQILLAPERARERPGEEEKSAARDHIVPDGGHIDTALRRLFNIDTRAMSVENIEKLVTTLVDEYAFVKNAINSMADFFIIVNEQYRIVKVNKFTCDFLAVMEHQVIGRDINQIFEVDQGELSDLLREIKLGAPLQLRAFARSGGQRRFPVVLTATVVSGISEGLQGIVIYARDISSEEQMLAQIADLERWRSLGEMAAGIAHEVNNPLAIIKDYSEILENLLEQPGEINRAYFAASVRKIIEVGERIARIVKGMLAFSRDGSKEEMRKVEVSSVISESINFCHERFKKSGVEIRLAGEIPEGATLICRPLEVSQVLMNLLVNGYDAVKTDSDPQNKWVEVEVRIGEREVQFAVTNPGPVIPEADLNKLFQPFYTTKDAEKGTGLGLSICKRMVESHGGVIYLDRQNPLTRFVFTISRRVHPVATVA